MHELRQKLLLTYLLCMLRGQNIRSHDVATLARVPLEFTELFFIQAERAGILMKQSSGNGHALFYITSQLDPLIKFVNKLLDELTSSSS